MQQLERMYMYMLAKHLVDKCSLINHKSSTQIKAVYNVRGWYIFEFS